MGLKKVVLCVFFRTFHFSLAMEPVLEGWIDTDCKDSHYRGNDWGTDAWQRLAGMTERGMGWKTETLTWKLARDNH